MKGIKKVRASNRFARYDFELKRNITIVRGDSGTGKSTLYNMIRDYTLNGEQSGVSITAPCNCIALSSDWENRLKNTTGSIIFIDEDYNKFLKTKEFAKAVQESDNYYVLFTREDLHELPYSVDEIYSIKMSGKYHRFAKMYKSTSGNGYYRDITPGKEYQKVLTEDSKSGYQFFKAVYNEKDIDCVPAGTNSKIYSMIKSNKEKMLIIADGAAFGSEIDRVMKLERSGFNFAIYLPESFEWLILKSGLVKDLDGILDNPSAFIESSDYVSWERFFTALLIEKTQDGYLEYKKNKLNPNYLHPKAKKAILEVMPEQKKKNIRKNRGA